MPEKKEEKKVEKEKTEAYYDSLANVNAVLTSHLDVATKEVEDQKKKAEAAVSRSDGLLQRVSKAEKESQDAQGHLHRVAGERDELLKKVSVHAARANELKVENGKLKKEVKELSKKVKDLMAVLKKPGSVEKEGDGVES